MTLAHAILLITSCLATQAATNDCIALSDARSEQVAGATNNTPRLTGGSLDVVITAQSAVAWDLTSGAVLYDKASSIQRPIASVSKLLAALVIRDTLPLNSIVEIPTTVITAQRQGSDINLPVGGHASVDDLLIAGLVASANDAMVTLASAVAGNEAAFVDTANAFAASHNLKDTKVANATGLPGGEQYSTAADVQQLLRLVYADPVLRDYLSRPAGTLVTSEGAVKPYVSTNKLLKTYVPIVLAKTGYTPAAGENLAMITVGDAGQLVGVVVLGSDDRFQDAKVLTEWIWRNYTWH